MGRKKGYKMSEAHKKAISEAHKKKHEEIKISNGRGFFGVLSSIWKRN